MAQTVPSVIILGADAIFAALPATPVQLAHACQRLGYASAFPASWGDELVADACLRDLADRGVEPAILCACPNVRERLLRVGDDLAPWMISLVAPPVAVARYLRAAYGARVLHITYAGSCPAARDPSIDVQLTPPELLALCRERGVSPASQPQLFEGVIPPDRRRSLSMPGGAPSDQALRELGGGRQLAELSADDALAELADHLIARAPVLLDLAPHIGCACSGVGDAVGGGDERRDLIALEPPRSPDPVVDPTVLVQVAMPWPSGASRPPVRPAATVPAPIAARPRPSVPVLPPLEPLVSMEMAATASVIESLQATPPLASAEPLPPRPLSEVVVLVEVVEPVDLAHAVIREYPHGEGTRRSIAITRRRSASETPAATLQGVSVPRAYLGKRPHRSPPRRSATAAAIDARQSRGDRERRIDHATDIADLRRPRRTPRSNVIPIAVDPPEPNPPPPPKRKPGTVLGIGAIIGLALSVAATPAIFG